MMILETNSSTNGHQKQDPNNVKTAQPSQNQSFRLDVKSIILYGELILTPELIQVPTTAPTQCSSPPSL